MPVFRKGIFQKIPHHGILIFVRVLMRRQEIIDHLKRLLSVVIIRVDDGKGTVHQRQTGQHCMSRSPGLPPAFRHLEALRQIFHLLESIFHFDPLLHAVSDGLFKILLILLLNDKDDLLKPCLHCIIDGKVHDDVSVRIHRINLLQTAVAASHTCCHNDEYWFLHFSFLLKIPQFPFRGLCGPLLFFINHLTLPIYAAQ